MKSLNTIKQPFRYYGGKQRIVDDVLGMIPKHRTYVEPFAGGASVFWYNRNPAPLEVLNDKDEYLINFYRCLQDMENYKDLWHRLTYTPYSRSELGKANQIWKDWKEGKEVDFVTLAWSFFVNINQGFAGDLNSGWGYEKEIYSLSNRRYFNRISQLKHFRERIKNAQINCIDALECIKLYDSDKTFFYTDPPYVGTGQGHYSGYTQDSLNDLITLLTNIKGKFLLSHYDNDACNLLFRKEVIPALNSSNKMADNSNNYREEVLYYNYNDTPQLSIF